MDGMQKYTRVKNKHLQNQAKLREELTSTKQKIHGEQNKII